MKDALAVLWHGFLWFFGGTLGVYTALLFIALLINIII
jgi:hypothetical protein